MNNKYAVLGAILGSLSLFMFTGYDSLLSFWVDDTPVYLSIILPVIYVCVYVFFRKATYKLLKVKFEKFPNELGKFSLMKVYHNPVIILMAALWPATIALGATSVLYRRVFGSTGSGG